MRYMPSKNPRRMAADRIRVNLLACGLSVGLSLLCSKAYAAEFLSPLPVQELEVGELYTLGIRPARAPARSELNTQLDLYAEGLSAGASFRRIGNEIWEFAWFPGESDKGVHVLRVLVTERGASSVVLEAEEITFVVGEVSPQPLATVDLSDDTILIEAAATGPLLTQETIADPVVRPVEKPVATTLSTSNAESSVTSDATWSLAPVASQIVTPHQWIRFDVALVSDAENIDEQVVVQIDNLPNGATFGEVAGGGRQFQWRPRTADQGEHQFRFTAVDKNDASRRENVTMRIIVQE